MSQRKHEQPMQLLMLREGLLLRHVLLGRLTPGAQRSDHRSASCAGATTPAGSAPQVSRGWFSPTGPHSRLAAAEGGHVHGALDHSAWTTATVDVSSLHETWVNSDKFVVLGITETRVIIGWRKVQQVS